MKLLPRQYRRGFTLIEIMVAMAIFAMVVAAIYATWSLILRSTQVGENAAARVQRERIALRTIEDSITCIQSFQASPQYYYFLVDNGTQPTLSFAARLPDTFPRNGKFDSNLRRLTFTVEAGPGEHENDLVLRQTPLLQDMDEKEQATPLVLAKYVTSFSVECWDTNTMDWVTEWDDTNSIPPMLRVSMALGSPSSVQVYSSGPKESDTVISSEITVPSVMLPTVLQNGQGGGGGSGGGRINNTRNQNNSGGGNNGGGNRGNGGGFGGGGGMRPQ